MTFCNFNQQNYYSSHRYRSPQIPVYQSRQYRYGNSMQRYQGNRGYQAYRGGVGMSFQKNPYKSKGGG